MNENCNSYKRKCNKGKMVKNSNPAGNSATASAAAVADDGAHTAGVNEAAAEHDATSVTVTSLKLDVKSASTAAAAAVVLTTSESQGE